jgi:copper(I)-binding protein
MRLAFAALLGLLLFTATAAGASTIEARGAWIRSTPPGAPTAAGYVTLINHGPATDRLMGGTTSVAGSVVPHQMTTTGGIMRMRPFPGGLAIGAAATVSLTPNGDHLMLIGLKRPLKSGEHVRIVLQFQRAGNITVDFPVRDAAPGGGMAGMHM